MRSIHFVGANLFSHFLKLSTVPFFQRGRIALEIGPQQSSYGGMKEPKSFFFFFSLCKFLGWG